MTKPIRSYRDLQAVLGRKSQPGPARVPAIREGARVRLLQAGRSTLRHTIIPAGREGRVVVDGRRWFVVDFGVALVRLPYGDSRVEVLQ